MYMDGGLAWCHLTGWSSWMPLSGGDVIRRTHKCVVVPYDDIYVHTETYERLDGREECDLNTIQIKSSHLGSTQFRTTLNYMHTGCY